MPTRSSAGLTLQLKESLGIDAYYCVHDTFGLQLDKAVRSVRRNYNNIAGPHILACSLEDEPADGTRTNQAAHIRVVCGSRRLTSVAVIRLNAWMK